MRLSPTIGRTKYSGPGERTLAHASVLPAGGVQTADLPLDLFDFARGDASKQEPKIVARNSIHLLLRPLFDVLPDDEARSERRQRPPVSC